MPPFDGDVRILCICYEPIDGSFQRIGLAAQSHCHTYMIDDELNVVELLDVPRHRRMFTTGVDHHEHIILGSGRQDMFMCARGQSFKVPTGSDTNAKPIRRLAQMSNWIFHLLVVGVKTHYI